MNNNRLLFSMTYGKWKHQLTISCGYLFLQLTILVRDPLRRKLHSEDAYLAQVFVFKANNAGLTPSTNWGSEDHRKIGSPFLPNPDSYASRGFIITKMAATGKFQTGNTLTQSVTIAFVHLFLFIYL